jgi:hypothetical protein
MGYLTKLQVIERKNNTRQYYLVCPAPLAQALSVSEVIDGLRPGPIHAE